MKSALVIVDFQEDFCQPHGSLGVEGGRELAPKINNLLKLPFALKIATRDWHPADHVSFASQHSGAEPFASFYENTNFENTSEIVTSRLWPDHCIQGTRGAELLPELDKSNIDHVIDKGQDKRVESYSAFGPPFNNPPVCKSDLAELLKKDGITHVFCVGIAFDYCVKATALDAVKEGFQTFVIEDACAGVDRGTDHLENTRNEMTDGGVVIIAADSEHVEMISLA